MLARPHETRRTGDEHDDQRSICCSGGGWTLHGRGAARGVGQGRKGPLCSCKGKGGCKGADNDCKGKNGCKGKGWMAMSEKKCTEKGGTVAPAPEKK
jgi:hypothetical protein